MFSYIIRRLAQAIPQLFIISIILFLLMQAFGDPIASLGVRTPPRPADRERLRRQLGLDQPVYMQYLVWLVGNDWMKIDMDGDGVAETPGRRRGVLRGDLGNSLINKRPVIQLITERIPNTLLLMVTVEIVIIIFSLLLGVSSAVKQYSFFDNFVTGISFVGYSIPIPLIALLLMYLFSVNFKEWGLPYLPTVGMFDPEVGRTPGQIALHMVLPVLSLALISTAGYSRYVRSSMLEVLGQDFIRTARAKGLREKLVVMKHALRNATLPFVTLIGIDLPFLLAGAVVTESIFGWPGTGRLFITHTTQSDFPVLMGILMMTALAVILFQLLTDLAYSYLDPRIRIE
ncbi:MAG TPA: ABC transporter permease [Anaerolineales bacterium]|nr:ABC transporter permease [Anaerolineales bacterium]